MSPDNKEHGYVPAVVCGDLNLLRCLADREIPLVVVASDSSEPTLRSRYAERTHLISEPSHAEQAVAELERIGREMPERPVLYYGTDAMLLLLSRHRARLEQLYRFMLPEPELVESCVDKNRFSELARRRDLPVPQSIASSEIGSARELLARMRLPCAFKPSVHIGWLRQRAEVDKVPKKAYRAETAAEVTRIYDDLVKTGSPFIVQQWISGGEEGIYSFHCYADERSRILGWFCGRKIRTYPKEAGVSTYLELVRDPKVAELGFEVVSRLGIVGPLKIDFKRDAITGELYVLELNPRFTLWCYLGKACGVNLPLFAYAHLAGAPLPAPRIYRTDIRWLSGGNDLRSFIRCYRPSGELSARDYIASLRSKKVYDVFSWRDPAPFIAAEVDYVKAASRRVARSVAAMIPAVSS